MESPGAVPPPGWARGPRRDGRRGRAGRGWRTRPSLKFAYPVKNGVYRPHRRSVKNGPAIRPCPARAGPASEASPASAPSAAGLSRCGGGIQPVLEPVAEEVEAEDHREDRQPRERGDPPVLELRPARRDHGPPFRLGRHRAQAEERQRGDEDDRVPDVEGRLDHDRGEGVRDHVHARGLARSRRPALSPTSRSRWPWSPGPGRASAGRTPATRRGSWRASHA